MTFPAHLKYTEDHEWIRIEEDGTAFIGITDYAQSELGEIVYVEVETEGEELDKGDEFGSVEAVKTTSDLYMPISGKVVEVNGKLEDNPELVNESPYEEGWIVKIELTNEAELDKLMDAASYQEQVGAE